MEIQIFQLVIPGVGLISGLIATYVSLQNRALLAEVRRELWPLALAVLVVVLMGEQFLGWYFGCGRNLSLLWRGVQK